MTCHLKELKTDYYLRQKDELDNFSYDQTIVIKESLLEHISDSYRKDTRHESTLDDWYPFANSYYPYTEDVDAFARVNHLLASKPSFASLSTIDRRSDIQEPTPYSGRSAQLQYLESNPVSFIILGKPGIGEEDLGRLLADYWNCVYINPEILIEQEVDSGSRAGQCIEFNLKCGRAIGIDVILRLVQKRVQSESAKHRGFVICGLPLIANDLYEEDPISSESAVFTVKEIFDEVLDVTIDTGIPPSKPHVSISSKYKDDDEEEAEEEEEKAEEEKTEGEQAEEAPPPQPVVEKEPAIPIDFGPDFDICEPPDIGTKYEEQLNFIFDLLKDPFLIIYVMCSTADVINKRDNYRYEIYTRQTFNLETEQSNKLLFNYFSRQEEIDVEEIPEEFFETSYFNADSSNYQRLVKLPRNFPANVSTQLDTFHYTALRFIERRVLMHDPQYFLKVDGRTNVQRMFHVIKSRLNILPLQKVLVPAKLNVIDDTLEMGEGEPEIFNTEGLSFEECYREFCKRQVPSIMFRWRWSNWYTKCPVSMREGEYRNGNPNLPVRFMNKIFFLADEQAFIKFYRNPRPYLLPPFPKPSSRIFLFGPKYSGRSEVATCLGYFLNSTVASVSDMIEQYIENQEEEIKEKVRQAAIAEAMKILNEQRIKEAAEIEAERVEKIRIWLAEVVDLIERLIVILQEIGEEEQQLPVTTYELSSFRMSVRKVSVRDIQSEVSIALIVVKDELEMHEVPYCPDIPYWQEYLKEKIQLLNFLPAELRTRKNPIPATVFDDFVIEYAENAVANADLTLLEMSNKNLVEMVKDNIKAIEENNLDEENGRSGWIIDGMMCNVSLIQDLYIDDCMADEVIVLQDEDEYEFLIEKFKTGAFDSFFREYRQFFMDIGKVDAAWRCPSIISTKSYKTRFVQGILYEMLDDEHVFLDQGAVPRDTVLSNEADDLREEFARFDEHYEEVKNFLLECDINPIEVKVTDKSITELMKDVICAIEDRYRANASILTEEDRAEEIKDIMSLFVQDVGEGGGGMESGEDLLRQHRRFGDTSYYCPVTLHENWVLWKGKEDFAVKFHDKIYLLSTEDDMNKFLATPRSFLTYNRPERIPPPRVCIVGVPGVGKTSISKAIAENFGLAYVSFESLLKKAFDINVPDTLDELRRNEETEEPLYNYLNMIEPLPEEIFNTAVSKIWNEYPIKTFGFVLDDFPKRPTDVELMVKYKLIPDIIIYLTNTEFDVKTKLMSDRLNLWENEMSVKRMLAEEENKQALLERENNRKKLFEELMEERRELRYSQKRMEKAQSPPRSPRDEGTDRSGSQVSFDSVAEQEDMNEVNAIVDLEYPELVLEPSLETLEEATDRFDILITDTMSIEIESLINIKNMCIPEEIPFTEVICDFKYDEITKRSAFRLIDPIKFRTKSHFERCYDVSMEVADRLLSCGYFLLSKFGKTCPVQYYENKNPIQMFIPMEYAYNLFPIIHRYYIYYVIGPEGQAKFKEDPLKYISVDFRFPLLALRVAVTGPPKCGKTILAQRIRDAWNMKYVSRGQAARYVLTYLPLSSLAKNMETVLRKGWELTDEMVAKCLEACCLDSKAVTQGVVFDGFPNTISEVKHLSYVGLVPNLVIDLQAKPGEVFECLSNDSGKRGFPRYSERFIEHLLIQWSATAIEFREWFHREYQVTARIPINTSNWSVLSQALDYINAVFFEIKHYFVHVGDDWPLRLANMQVTPLEFLERQGCYKTYCPCCLHFFNELSSGGEPPDRTGLVHFRKYFYWICSEHIERFLKRPEAYIPPYNNHALPPYLPVILHLRTMPANVFENGKCIVCFMTKRLIVKGFITLAVGFINSVYLFDTKECLDKFMRTPMRFAGEIDFNPPDNYPALKYAELPPLGMLEQYVANPITKALNFISRRRPIVPGLSIRASAAIGIGLYLKVNFARISNDYMPYYKEADQLYHERRTKLTNYLDSMKSVINPYLHYEEPMPAFEIPPSVRSESTDSVNTAVSKIVSEIVENAMFD